MLIDNNSSLRTFCDTAAPHDWIAVDTEFMRQGRYWPHLCLVQVALPSGEAVAIDPLADGCDLTPLYQLLHAPSPLKVFHDCRQDAEIVYIKSGAPPYPIFDTQLAACLCGFAASLSLSHLHEQCLDAPLDKSPQMSDWSERPLPSHCLQYALNDVLALIPLYGKITQRLTEQKRLHWLDDELFELSSSHLYDHDPSHAWRRFAVRKHTHQWKPLYRTIIEELAHWREKKAQERDVPRPHIITDDAIKHIAQHPPHTIQELQAILKKNRCRRQPPAMMAEMMTCVTRAHDTATQLASPQKIIPLQQREKELRHLKKMLHETARHHAIAPSLIATVHELEEMVLAIHKGRLLQGWRYDLFGKPARAFLNQ